MRDDIVFVSDDHKIEEILICFSIFLKSDFCKDLKISESDLKSMRDLHSYFIKKLDPKNKDYNREEVIYDYKKGSEDMFRFFINMYTCVLANTDLTISLKGLSLLSYLIAEKSNIDLVLDMIEEYLMKNRNIQKKG